MSEFAPPFLTAEWRHLAMLNYVVDPQVLGPLVPAGTELDDWQGHTFVSVIGFLFLSARVLGVAIPFHQNFEEVNLRFYVRRKAPEGWRRGVVFVKEIVPRSGIAITARVLYGENYVALPMAHRITREHGAGGVCITRDPVPGSGGVCSVSYSWQLRGHGNSLGLSTVDNPVDAAPGSDAEFITEHYWGYTRRPGGQTTEYRVEHPRWRVTAATTARLDCDVPALYGSTFAEFLEKPPHSAFHAEGSKISVSKGRRLER